MQKDYKCDKCFPKLELYNQLKPAKIIDKTDRTVSYDDLRLMLDIVDKAGYCSELLRQKYNMNR